MDRQHRRELKHDKFVDELGTLSTRARENQRVLIAITAVVLLGVGVGLRSQPASPPGAPILTLVSKDVRRNIPLTLVFDGVFQST